MYLRKSIVATTELLLVLPAALFMACLFIRNVVPPENEPARSAQLVVDWFSARRIIGLDVLLVLLPFLVFIVGCTVLARSWFADAKLRQAALETFAAIRAHLANLLVATATVIAAGILLVVGVHVIAN